MERKIDTGQIFSEAFDYWKSVMRFNLAFSILYFSLFMLLTYGLANSSAFGKNSWKCNR